MRLSRRQLLMGSVAAGLAACSRSPSQQRSLELWTLQLAPKFNDYFADVLDAWLEYGPPVPVPVRWTRSSTAGG